MATTSISELREIAAKGNQPLPAGPYLMEVTNATFTTKTNGNDVFTITYTVTSGPYKGKTVRDYLTISDASVPVVFSKLAALGLDDAWWAQVPVTEIDQAAPYVAQALIGRTFGVQVKVDEYNKRLNNKVDKILTDAEAAVAFAGGQGAAPVPSVPSVPQRSSGTASFITSGPAPIPTVPNLPPGL